MKLPRHNKSAQPFSPRRRFALLTAGLAGSFAIAALAPQNNGAVAEAAGSPPAIPQQPPKVTPVTKLGHLPWDKSSSLSRDTEQAAADTAARVATCNPHYQGRVALRFAADAAPTTATIGVDEQSTGGRSPLPRELEDGIHITLGPDTVTIDPLHDEPRTFGRHDDSYNTTIYPSGAENWIAIGHRDGALAIQLSCIPLGLDGKRYR